MFTTGGNINIYDMDNTTPILNLLKTFAYDDSITGDPNVSAAVYDGTTKILATFHEDGTVIMWNEALAIPTRLS